MPDGLLQKKAALFTHFAQVGIARKNNALLLWQWLPPGRARRHHSNPLYECAIVQGRCAWIKTREFMELYRGPAQNEATPGISTLPCFRSPTQMSDSVLVFEHSHVSEGERVAIDTKRRRVCAD